MAQSTYSKLSGRIRADPWLMAADWPGGMPAGAVTKLMFLTSSFQATQPLLPRILSTTTTTTTAATTTTALAAAAAAATAPTAPTAPTAHPAFFDSQN